MNLNSAALRLMAEKGLSLQDVAEIVAANEQASDPTAAQRMRNMRARRKANKVTRNVTPTPPPNERDNLTPREVSEADASSPQPRAWSLPSGVSLQVWEDFKRNRSKKRLPNTDTAWKGFLDDLERVSLQTGIPPPKLIEMCTAKGWGAIYDPRTENDRPQRANSMGRHQSADGLSPTTRAAISVFGLPQSSDK